LKCAKKLNTIGPRTKEHKNDFKKARLEKEKIEKEREELYQKFKNTRQQQKELQDLKTLHADEDNSKQFKTALLQHAITCNHQFDYDNVQILHHANNVRKRKKLEAMYIYNENIRSCNFKQDTIFLPVASKLVINAKRYMESKIFTSNSNC
jgi:hypothetical protein